MNRTEELGKELDEELKRIGEPNDSTTEENLKRVSAVNQAYIRYGEKIKDLNEKL